jgi:hypothetical protein
MYIDEKVKELAARATDPAIKAFLNGAVEALAEGRPAAEEGQHPTLPEAKGARKAGQELGMAIVGSTTF